MGQTNRIGRHATKVITSTLPHGATETQVRYHATAVVTVIHSHGACPYDTIMLNSGGWRTPTTKRRMNQVSNEWALGFTVYQRNHDWFVDTRWDGTLPFTDGMTFIG